MNRRLNGLILSLAGAALLGTFSVRGADRPSRPPSDSARPRVTSEPLEYFEAARRKEADEKWRAAARYYRRLVKDYPDSELAPDAQFRLGYCLGKSDRLYDAFRAYRELLRRYPGKGNLGEILERKLVIGRAYLEGRRRPFLFLRLRSGLPVAAEIFQSILETAVFSDVSPEAQYGLGMVRLRQGRYEEAEFEFEKVLSRYSLSERVPDALFQLGLCAYERALRADYDQFFVDRAARWFETFLRRHPDHPRREEARTKLADLLGRRAESLFRVGKFYQRRGRPEGARIYYREVVRKYPETSRAADARKRLAEMERAGK